MSKGSRVRKTKVLLWDEDVVSKQIREGGGAQGGISEGIRLVELELLRLTMGFRKGDG
jgi:hypothetical protein